MQKETIDKLLSTLNLEVTGLLTRPAEYQVLEDTIEETGTDEQINKFRGIVNNAVDFASLDDTQQYDLLSEFPFLSSIKSISCVDDSVLAKSIKANPRIVKHMSDPPLELQKLALTVFWGYGVLHQKFDNDDFLRSEWIRKMKIKHGSLSNIIPQF